MKKIPKNPKTDIKGKYENDKHSPHYEIGTSETIQGRIEQQLKNIAKKTKLENLEKLKPKQSRLPIILSLISIFISLFVFIIGKSFSDNHQPLDYQISNIQPNSEKVGDGNFTASPLLNIFLDRNGGGLKKDIFLADFDNSNNIVITPTSHSTIKIQDLLDKIIPNLNQIAKEATSQSNFESRIATASSDYLKPDYAINHQEASIPTDISPYNFFPFIENNNIQFFDGNLALYHQPKIAPKFIVLKGMDNDYQILTFFYILNKTHDNSKDVVIHFNTLELFSNYSWENKINVKNLTSEEKKQIADLKYKTQEQYTKLLDFIRNPTLQDSDSKK